MQLMETAADKAEEILELKAASQAFFRRCAILASEYQDRCQYRAKNPPVVQPDTYEDIVF